MTTTPSTEPRSLDAEYLPTVFALLVLSFCLQKHGGLMALLAAPVAALWLLVGAVIAIRRPARRRPLAVKTIALAAMFVAIAIVHAHYATAARAMGQQVADGVLAFEARSGHYPAHLAEIGLDDRALAKDWMLHYAFFADRPSLFYGATFIVFDTYEFDFDTRTWAYRAD